MASVSDWGQVLGYALDDWLSKRKILGNHAWAEGARVDYLYPDYFVIIMPNGDEFSVSVLRKWKKGSREG